MSFYSPDRGKKIKYEITFQHPIFAFAGFAGDFVIKDEMTRCGVITTTRPNETIEKSEVEHAHNMSKKTA